MTDPAAFLSDTQPFASLPQAVRAELATRLVPMTYGAYATIYGAGEELAGLYLITAGEVHVYDDAGHTLSILQPGNQFGERGLTRGGIAVTTAMARTEAALLMLPADGFARMCAAHPDFAAFYARTPTSPRKPALSALPVSEIMSCAPLTCDAQTTLQVAAMRMAEAGVSSLVITGADDTLTGIVTVRDMAHRAVAKALPPETAISTIMTAAPLALPQSALVSDVLHLMLERRISHLPIVDAQERPVGIITQTDLTRYQALTSGSLIDEIAHAANAEQMARSVARIPELLAQLVAASHDHHVITRLITDIADAATRRLLTLAEATLGPAPVPYVWAACGSQGRQEQTGVSDQDNVLILSDDLGPGDDAYFEQLARFVCDGLDVCGYFYCPGEMMARTARWRQPLHTWKGYFRAWISTPDPEAQMLASVMFDLRAIGGEAALLDELVAETLGQAHENSIFVAHMVSNSLKHQPPLGLWRGLATIRSGEHKHTLDLKHAGVVPITDLGRVYALTGSLRAVNTRARLEEATGAGVISEGGGRDLLDAYDMIAETRLRHQAAQIKSGDAPDNFMDPSDLSDFERSHLRDAFVVVKTMQSAAASGRGMAI